MAKFRVHGIIPCSIDMLVEAESKDDAMDIAYDTWPGMSDYVGNGKSGGAMCGPHQEDETDANIWGDGEPEFTNVEEEA